MAIHLAKPINIYFASENTVGRLDRCFAADAMVRDEGRTIQGIAAIKAWRSETGEKYHHTVEPLSVTERDGKTVVTAKVSGNFPGSPVNLDHIFELHGNKIVWLEIPLRSLPDVRAARRHPRGPASLDPIASSPLPVERSWVLQSITKNPVTLGA